jgi:hypothetical protein
VTGSGGHPVITEPLAFTGSPPARGRQQNLANAPLFLFFGGAGHACFPFSASAKPRGWSAARRVRLSSCRILFWRTRALLGSPSRRLAGAGPRFLTFRFALPPASQAGGHLLGDRGLRASGRPNGRPSASYSQGIVVSPAKAVCICANCVNVFARVPAPPKRAGHVSPRPQASHLVPSSKRLAKTPSAEPGETNITTLWCAGISSRAIVIIVL